MQLKTADSSKEPWTKRALGALAIVLLAAVPALGLTTLVRGSFPLRQLGEDGQGTGPDVGVSDGPFTFDAPTATLQRVRPAAAAGVGDQSGGGDASARAEAILLTDWRFTQSSQQELNAILAAELSFAQWFQGAELSTFLLYQQYLQSETQLIAQFLQAFQNLVVAEELLFLQIFFGIQQPPKAPQSPHQ